MNEIEEALDLIKAKGLYRSLRPVSGRCLCSNDYLNLAEDERVRNRMMQALKAGVPHGSTGSRLLSGHAPIFEDLEAGFREWQGTEAALFFSSGFSANLGLLTAVLDKDTVVLSDELNHASLIDGIRLSKAKRILVPHMDLSAFEKALKERVPERTYYVVVESIYSMDGDRTPLVELADICWEYGARLIVDEAHATGLFGSTGAGLVEEAGVRSKIFASVHTCGKALGQMGAFVCGSANLRDLLINRSRSFIYSTAPPPFLAAGLLEAMEIIQRSPDLRRRPVEVGEKLRALLKGRVDTGASDSQILPLMVGPADAAMGLAAFLEARNWDARAIRPPTVPDGTCRIRIALHNRIADGEIEELAGDILAGFEEVVWS